MSEILDLEVQLEKTRRLASSSLSNHQQYAGTLIAVEETLKEQNTELVPSSYVAALVTLLEQQRDNGYDFVGPILYLLAIVLDYVPRNVAQAQFSTIMSILASSLDLTNADPMLIRSVITCLESLLKAQDSRTWKQPIAKKATQSIFIFSLDQRPKVRRRAQEAAHNILLDVPRPLVEHPMANGAADFIIQSFEETNNDINYNLHILNFISNIADSIPTKRVEDICEKLLQVLAINNPFIATETFKIFDKIFNKITVDFDKKTLLTILNTLEEQKPNANNTELSVTWLNIIKSGFNAYSRLDPESCESKVSHAFALVFSYLELGKMQVKPTAVDCLNHLVSRCIRQGNQCSATISKELSSMLIDALGYRYRESWPGVFLITASLAYRLGESCRPAMDELLLFIEKLRMDKVFELKKEADAALCSSLESMGPKLFLDLFPLNIELCIPGLPKTDSSKSIKPASASGDIDTEGRAWLLPLMKGHMKNVNISFFVENLLPLATKLDEHSFALQKSGRAIQSKVTSTLAIQIWALLGDFFYSPNDISEQINSEFIGMILNQITEVQELRSTLINALDILVKQVLARSKASVLDDSKNPGDQASGLTLPKADVERAIKDQTHLAKFTPAIMSTMFTLAAETPGPRCRYIHDATVSFLSVTRHQDITKASQRVINMLSKALISHITPTAAESTNKFFETNPQPPAYSLLDLVGTLAQFLDEPSAFAGIDVVLPIIKQTEDANLQKKAYKLLRLFFVAQKQADDIEISESANNDKNSDEFNQKISNKIVPELVSASEFVLPLSRKNRLALLATAVKYLPKDELHLIPVFLSEAIIGTKEINEKSRTSAFDLLVAMAEKMEMGGKVSSAKISNIDNNTSGSGGDNDDDGEKMENDADISIKPASVEEYFNMVVAGFAAKTPYMISATVTSLAYLLNIFYSKLSLEFTKEMIDTVLMFVNSNSREIAKASLGFIKVVVIELPKQFLEPILKEIVGGILKWANEHKARFAVKSKHIIERLIRKFGIDAVEQATPEEHKKLILNIRKRQIRAKRGKSGAGGKDATSANKDQSRSQRDYDESESGGQSSEDSNASNSEDDIDRYRSRKSRQKAIGGNGSTGATLGSGPGQKFKSGKNSQHPKTWIMEDTEKNDPLEFLSRSAFSQLSISKPSGKSKSHDKSSASSFVKTTKEGKFIFAEDSDNELSMKSGGKDGASSNKAVAAGSNGISAPASAPEDFYKQSLTNPDGFDRGMRNKIKFNKRKNNNGDDDDMDNQNGAAAGQGSRNKNDTPGSKRQRANAREYGSEYKSKKGRGDVKKKGKLEPFAYIPLDAKKLTGKVQNKVQIMSKSKKDKRSGRK